MQKLRRPFGLICLLLLAFLLGKHWPAGRTQKAHQTAPLSAESNTRPSGISPDAIVHDAKDTPTSPLAQPASDEPPPALIPAEPLQDAALRPAAAATPLVPTEPRIGREVPLDRSVFLGEWSGAGTDCIMSATITEIQLPVRDESTGSVGVKRHAEQLLQEYVKSLRPKAQPPDEVFPGNIIWIPDGAVVTGIQLSVMCTKGNAAMYQSFVAGRHQAAEHDTCRNYNWKLFCNTNTGNGFILKWENIGSCWFSAAKPATRASEAIIARLSTP